MIVKMRYTMSPKAMRPTIMFSIGCVFQIFSQAQMKAIIRTKNPMEAAV